MVERPEKAQQKMLLNLALDIVLPVMILNKLSPYLGDNGSMKALSAWRSHSPLGHGLYDFWQEKKINWISLLRT